MSHRWVYVVRHVVHNNTSLFAICVFVCLVLLGVFSPLIAPYDPIKMYPIENLTPPNSSHLFGTDNFGRDLFSRVLYGIRNSLMVASLVALVTTIFGGIAGLLAGYYKRLDATLMRTGDILMSFPSLVLAICIVALLGASSYNAIIAMAVVYTPRTSRIAYSSALTIKQETFIEAARALGSSGFRILVKHILPNCFASLIVQATFVFALAVLVEASLSFLGAGTPPPNPSLGNILSEAREYIRRAPWIMLLTGGVITSLVLSVNFIGDALREALDPKMGGNMK